MPMLLEQYRIADFLDWNAEKRLVLNPHFQRGSVWNPTARTFLIDTILRELPIPKVYLRTTVNVTTKKSVREVVDGQQRLKAIIDFAQDKLVLSKRAGEFGGLRYSTLPEELQSKFLEYPIAVDQLMNASDDDVLEVFARLNSYSVALNPPEKRHAKYQGEFKWAVRSASRKWAVLWDDLEILSVRERVRMLDDSLTAEMLGVLLEGVKDGGQTKIDALYKKYDATFSSDSEEIVRLDEVLRQFVDNISDGIRETSILSPPHFLMLFSAIAYVRGGIPDGDLDQLPQVPRGAMQNFAQIIENLLVLNSVIESDEPGQGFSDFWRASRSTTHRIASRKVRFPVFVAALGSDPIS